MAFDVGVRRGRWIVVEREERRVFRDFPNHLQEEVVEAWVTWECDGYGNGEKHRQTILAVNSYGLWGCKRCARARLEKKVADKAAGIVSRPGRKGNGPVVSVVVPVPVDLIAALYGAAERDGMGIKEWMLEAAKEKLFG